MKSMRVKNKNNNGSTMVETLVSFVVLFIVLAALYGIVSFSSELYMRSVDTSRLHQRFYREIYKFPSGPVTNPEAVSIDESFLEYEDYYPGYYPSEPDGHEYACLSLIFDTEKTDLSNYGSGDSRIADAYIDLKYTGVTSYVCVDEGAADEKLILPKTLHFWWLPPVSVGD